MKKLMIAAVLMAATAALADARLDIRPGATDGEAAPSAVDWQNKDDAKLQAATDGSVLADFVSDEASASALLAQVKGAYATDPTVALQIAAVSQWVMLPDPWYCLFWDGPRASGRTVWIKALCARIRGTSDTYVKVFCLDQLRWCGKPCTAKCVAEIAAQEKDSTVKSFAATVVRELEAAE